MGRRVPSSPNIEQPWTKALHIKYPLGPLEILFFAKTKDLAIYTGINLWASDPDKESFRPIHHLPIYTDTDSNRFLGLLTLAIPIPIFRYEYHTDTDTDFLKNTDIPIPIPIIPIIGPSLVQTHFHVNPNSVELSWGWVGVVTINRAETGPCSPKTWQLTVYNVQLPRRYSAPRYRTEHFF